LTSLLTCHQGWHGVELSGFKPGETVAVFGGGPVGLMAAYSAQLRGASRVFVVDRVPERLKSAEKIGCIAIDFTKGDAVEEIIKANDGEMVDRSVDAVGYQAVDTSGSSEQPNIVLENMIKVTRACGGLGIPGLYVPRYGNSVQFVGVGTDVIQRPWCSRLCLCQGHG
jgi:threonine dehydrogenase-like Zn-dependent dehydrogenase